MTTYADKNLETFSGLWRGPCLPEHGPSRAHQSRILHTGGGEIFTVENPDRVDIGTRVRYRVGFDALGIEQIAVEVTPIEPAKRRK